MRSGVVIATEAFPVIPPIPGLASTPYWTNRLSDPCFGQFLRQSQSRGNA